MNARKKAVFGVAWLIIAFAAALIYYNWHVKAQFVGVVENKKHEIEPQIGGEIKSLQVAVGDAVKKGQLLFQLDTSDLEAYREKLQDELATIEALKKADKNRFLVESKKLKLQLDSDKMSVDSKIADYESKKAQLQILDDQIENLKKAEESGLGRQPSLNKLLVERDGLKKYLENFSLSVKGTKEKDFVSTLDPDSFILSMESQRLKWERDVLRDLKKTENAIAKSSVYAPCDGMIVSLHARQGDVVKEFSVVLELEETQVDYLVVYIPLSAKSNVTLGTSVTVSSTRPLDDEAVGVVTFLYPTTGQIPQQLTFRNNVYFARKVRVKLTQGHNLLPGETVLVRIGGSNASAAEPPSGAKKEAPKESNNDKEPQNGTNAQIADAKSLLRPINVPASLMEISAFEPSGVIWLPDIRRYLIISDDTGLKKPNKRAPWLYLMDESGNVEAEPVVIQGAGKINDLESAAAAKDGKIYFLASQNLDKDGERKTERRLLVETKRDGRTFTQTASVDLFSAIFGSLSNEKLAELGVKTESEVEKTTFNVEALAAYEDGLLLGLKQPAGKGGAIIWKLSDLKELFASQKIKEGRLSLFAELDMGQYPAGRGSISDLIIDSKGRLVATSTIVLPHGDKNQVGSVFLFEKTAAGYVGKMLARFDGLKPEGICEKENGKYLVVFDEDGKPSHFASIEIK